jgi:hypothetical protein
MKVGLVDYTKSLLPYKFIIMIKWFKSLVTNYKRVKELETEIVVLNDKIIEKQDIINKTNAYWKKKMYHQNKKAKEL